MESNNSSYRPHDPGHDYYAPGIYLITLVVRDRSHQSILFGHLNDDPKAPSVILSPLGEAVLACWNAVPRFQEAKGRKVRVLSAICMPDHFHGVIEVLERMDKSLGQVIWGFKVACTKCYRALMPNTAPDGAPPSFALQPFLAAPPDLHRMSAKKRAEYYAQHPSASQPLWDDNYDDTICLSGPSAGAYDSRHLAAMLRYVDDNPRRAIMRRLHPEYMSRRLHLIIRTKGADGAVASREYAAFGNLFLFRWSRKVQVFCHRKARMSQLTDEERSAHGYRGSYSPDFVTSIPYEQTASFRNDCRLWKAHVMSGATVIITPGISKGERIIKDRCLASHYPLIHLQKEPIGRYWKPELSRFEACISGSLLILAPWHPDDLGDVAGVPSNADYSIFHNLNQLAKELVECEVLESTVRL